MDQRFVELNILADALEKQLDDINEKRHALLIELVPELKDSQIEMGTHECPESPNGICVYDTEMDPCCDECLFCDQPHERK